MVGKILFLASNPTNTGRLRLDKEVREISEGLRRSKERNRFDLVPIFAVRVNDLRRSLLDFSPRIVHFTGHDGTDGIVVEDDQGKAIQVPNDALTGLFELCAGNIDCVILNACYSEVQADAIVKHVPFVIGMMVGVSDDAAIEFSVGFYDALGAGKSIEEAFRFGCNAIALKNIPEHLTPVLKKKPLSTAERQRLEASYSPTSDVYVEISVTNETGAEIAGLATVLQYSLDRNEHRIKIERNLGYLALFDAGGPIAPLNYLTPTWCAFKWDFPILDFKVLNGKLTPLYLTEVVLDVEESRLDEAPLFTIKKDTQRRWAGRLLLVNEGGCEIANVTASFDLLPGEVESPTDIGPPFRHSVTLPLLKDSAEIDFLQAFQDEGVDFNGLSRLGNGRWEEDTYVIQKSDGSEERISEAEAQKRWNECLGTFQNEVGTVVGEFDFTPVNDSTRKHNVKFHAPVYLSDLKRMGIPKPSSFMYDTAFETENSNYQKRVQISHTLQPGEADRFTIKVAVAKSSFHRFRATLREVTGLTLHSLPIEIRCFVPRSRWKVAENAISSVQSKGPEER